VPRLATRAPLFLVVLRVTTLPPGATCAETVDMSGNRAPADTVSYLLLDLEVPGGTPDARANYAYKADCEQGSLMRAM